MKALERMIASLARFVVGLGIGFAFTSVYVIATGTSLEPARIAAPAEIATLAPAAAVDDEAPAVAAPRSHVFGRGPLQV